jgi:hypothetical protein
MKKPGGSISAPGLMVNFELTSFIGAYPQVCVRPGHIISPGEKHSTTPTHAGFHIDLFDPEVIHHVFLLS